MKKREIFKTEMTVGELKQFLSESTPDDYKVTYFDRAYGEGYVGLLVIDDETKTVRIS